MAGSLGARRRVAIITSLALHVAVGLWLWTKPSTSERKTRRTTVAVVAKKKMPPKEPERPKEVAKATVDARPRVRQPMPAPPPAPPPATPAAPVRTGLVLSNTPGSPAPGAGSSENVALRSGAGGAEPRTERTLVPKSDPSPCEEAPTKPEVSARPSEIEYLAETRAAGVEGRLVLRLTIDVEGNVAEVEVVSSVDDALDAAAIATVKAWRFRPATRCGAALPSTYTLARRFELGD